MEVRFCWSCRAMDVPFLLVSMEREDLIELVKKLIGDYNKLEGENLRLEVENDSLKKRIEEELRKGARAAAPFSKNRPKPDPKKPGRKKGQGKFKNREAPAATEPPVNVPVEEKQCECGGEFKPDGHETVTRTCLPPAVPVAKSYNVEMCRCNKCGRRVRGRHPEVPPDQTGATAHRVDDEVYALAHAIHYGLGVPVSKVPAIMSLSTGIRLTQSALTQDALKRSRRDLAAIYAQLRDEIRHASTIYTDDTGWRINGLPAYLMAFDSDLVAFYQIRPQHRHQEVLEVIGEDFQGNLSSDRGVSYDAEALKRLKQNKCNAHLLRNIREILKEQKPAAQTIGTELIWILRQSGELWKAYRAGKVSRKEYDREGEQLDRQLKHALRTSRLRRLRDPDNIRLLKELGWHYDRGNLLRFLKDPGIEPTNNRAERALRPMVIQRKVSHCSKNKQGAEATAKFVSVIRTGIKQGIGAARTLLELFQGRNPLQPPAAEASG
ncbi:MAG: IS66 family transposase [Candidatus Eremiobacteraeota bacterium]|nr:IS66 family transposase [Candidatus Eremiobacteraeota bacterium]